MIKDKGVLYVDDESANLVAFKATFRRLYNVYTATSGAEGLELLRGHPDICVVLSDQKMPNMTGVEFLNKVYDKYPFLIRILVTGFADIEAVVNAINQGKVFKYLTKPWNFDTLNDSIEEGFQVFNKAKEQKDKLSFFLYKLSHDLRGPLVSIEGLIDIAKIEEGEANKLLYFNLMQKSIDRLDHSLTEIIEIGQVEQELRATLVEIDCGTLVDKVVTRIKFADQAFKTQINIEKNIGSPAYSDRVMFESLIQNLLQNAIKYGDGNKKGGAKVNVKIEVNETLITLKVEDNGIGISEEVQKNVFDMFYRGTSTVTGTGLGLYIVKSIVTKLEGITLVNSIEGKGSSFEIQLPNKFIKD